MRAKEPRWAKSLWPNLVASAKTTLRCAEAIIGAVIAASSRTVTDSPLLAVRPPMPITPLLLGLGQTFVVISGGIDLSVGFTMASCGRDTGSSSNLITLPDGRVAKSAYNEEQVEIRGLIEGEYIVNVHMYRKSAPTPTKVIVTLYKVAEGEDVQIHESERQLKKRRFDVRLCRRPVYPRLRAAPVTRLGRSLAVSLPSVSLKKRSVRPEHDGCERLGNYKNF